SQARSGWVELCSGLQRNQVKADCGQLIAYPVLNFFCIHHADFYPGSLKNWHELRILGRLQLIE
ncbi:MAG: hypothetical protein FWC84_04700, partial [Alphaproteobacteria bacterium]|nr:hypothetical protein [Alphaproteobacteria bacterium]